MDRHYVTWSVERYNGERLYSMEVVEGPLEKWIDEMLEIHKERETAGGYTDFCVHWSHRITDERA